MAMESASVVRLSKLSKRYGSYPALTDVAFEIEPGEVFGYLGPNGAGKTTTIRILLGLLRPSSGCATVFGMDSWRDRVRIHARTGYVPGEPGFWDRLTGVETLTYLARLRDSRGQVARGREIATRLDLDLERPVRALSRGNKQKLALVQALMGDPELLVLDEPTSGLDPLVQHEFHAMVLEMTHAAERSCCRPTSSTTCNASPTASASSAAAGWWRSSVSRSSAPRRSTT